MRSTLFDWLVFARLSEGAATGRPGGFRLVGSVNLPIAEGERTLSNPGSERLLGRAGDPEIPRIAVQYAGY